MEENRKTGYPHIDNIHKEYYGEKGKRIIDIDKTMFRYIYDRRKDFEGTAFEYYGQLITYDEMFDEIIKYASAFKNLGINNNDTVTFLLPSCPTTYYMIYALSMLGASRNMVDLRTSVSGIKKYINETNSKFLICMNNTSKKVIQEIFNGSSIEQVITTNAPLESFSSAIKRQIGKVVVTGIEKSYLTLGSKVVLPSEFEETGAKHIKTISELEREYIAEAGTLYLHTSGTMKFPKTVVSTDKEQNFVATQYEKAHFDLREHEKFLAIMPPWIYYGIMGFHMPLSMGMTVQPIPDPNGQKFEDLILDLKPNVVAGVPNHFISLYESNRITPKTDFSFARVFACGGAAINSEKQEEISQMLMSHGALNGLSPGYSFSENTSVGTANQANYTKSGSVGIPLPDIEVMVIDKETQKPLKYNETGIICLRGALMKGYLGDEEETSKVLVNIDGKDWAISGDIGHVDEDGFVYIEGREKNVIIGPDGFKISSNEIESKICTHPAVKNCIVIGIKDKKHEYGDLPIAYIELKDPKINRLKLKKIAEEIKMICQKELSSYYLPAGYYFGRILFTSMMKDDKEAMRKRYEAAENESIVKKLVFGKKLFK